MIRISGIVFLLLMYGASSGQQAINGFVLDAKTKNPVPGAHVFLVSTSHGTITDENGSFQLTAESGNYELGITHVSYDPIFLDVSLSQIQERTFLLNPSVHVIDEIEVTAPKSNKRARYLNRFRRALLGESTFAKNCVIYNPHVLLFQNIINGGFSATTTDLLQINNQDLGYEIYLYLEYFESSGITTSYGSKVFLKEINPISNNQKTVWHENRKKAYRGSKRHFLEALIQDRLKEEGFTIKHARVTANDELEIIKAANRKQLIVENDNHKALTIPEALVVNYLGKNAFVGPASSYGQVSYLIPKTQVIDITDPLSIPPHQMVEKGLWAKSGLANWLPYDYQLEGPMTKQIVYINGFALDPLSIPVDQIKRGGPPRDGIPAISNPQFSPSNKAKFMHKTDRVLGVHYNGVTRAYPVKILDRHEIVNDQYDEEHIVISYCPLCNSGMVFKGLIDELNREFGVSGLLYNSDVLMYDKQTESLWSQILGEAISGKSIGQKLEYIPVIHTTWEDWINTYSESQVLTMPKDLLDRYDNPVYVNYRNSKELMFPVSHSDNTLENKSWIVGITIDGYSKAYPFSYLEKNPSLTDQVNGHTINISFDKKNLKAIISDSAGTLLPAHTMYWFAWKSFHPKTQVFGINN